MESEPRRSQLESSSGVYLVPYPVDTEDYFPGVKWLEREADYSPPSSV